MEHKTIVERDLKQVRVHVWTVCWDKKEAVLERWQFVLITSVQRKYCLIIARG